MQAERLSGAAVNKERKADAPVPKHTGVEKQGYARPYAEAQSRIKEHASTQVPANPSGGKQFHVPHGGKVIGIDRPDAGSRGTTGNIVVNPGVQDFNTAGESRTGTTGTSVDLGGGTFNATGKPNTGTPASTIVNPELTRSPALHAQVETAESLRRNAAERSDIRYVDQDTAVRHREMLDKLVRSAKRVEESENKLSRSDRAIAKFLIASANVEAIDIDRLAGPQVALRQENLMSLRDATGRVREVQQRLDAGRPPLDYRAVRVQVLDRADSKRHVPGLRVYALPKDMIERPERYPPELLRELLHDLSLEKMTSPAQGLVPLSDLRIWVGPEFAYDQMQKLVLEKKLVQYKPVHAQATSATLDLVFFDPDDLPQVSAVK